MTSEYGKDSKNHGCMLTKIMQSLQKATHTHTKIQQPPHQDRGELLSLRLLGQILESCEAEVGGW